MVSVENIPVGSSLVGSFRVTLGEFALNPGTTFAVVATVEPVRSHPGKWWYRCGAMENGEYTGGEVGSRDSREIAERDAVEALERRHESWTKRGDEVSPISWGG